MKYRVMRVAPAAYDPPCCCSQETASVIWEGDDPDAYSGGLGAFDNGCCHPTRWMEKFIPGTDGKPGRWVEYQRQRVRDTQGNRL